MIKENFRCIGKLSKLHGYEGEALLIAESAFSKNDTKTEWAFLMIDGLPVPFFISTFRIRTSDSAIVAFTDVSTESLMKAYIGLELYVIDKRLPKKHKSTIGQQSVNGYAVHDNVHGAIGMAETVLDYNGNFLLQVFNNHLEILIPVNESIVIDINNNTKVILVNLPNGFMELYK